MILKEDSSDYAEKEDNEGYKLIKEVVC